MRFLVQPAGAHRLRPPVRVFLVFAALAVAGLAAQRIAAGGLSAAGVVAHYRGADEGEALPAVALWEEVHAGAFVYGFVLFVLGSLLAVGPLPSRGRAALLWGAAAAALADLFAPFAVTLLGAGGALRVVTSVLAWGSIAALLAAVARGLEGRAGERRD